MPEQLLIQQAALCWLKLNLVELSYSNTMKQSITLTLGVLGETIECRSKKVHPSLRDSRSRAQALTQYSSVAVQYSNEWRAAGEPHEVCLTRWLCSKCTKLEARIRISLRFRSSVIALESQSLRRP